MPWNTNYLEYKIIMGGEPEKVFRKLGLENVQDCGCEHMATLQERLDSFAAPQQEKWELTEAKSEIYCCAQSPSYDELKSFGRPPKEGTVLIEAKFKNQRYMHEIIKELGEAFGMELMFLDKRLDN
jgi:hypothetical protein